MDEEEVEVVQAPQFELVVSKLLYVFFRMEGVPQFGGDD